jgi:hypothetical protein
MLPSPPGHREICQMRLMLQIKYSSNNNVFALQLVWITTCEPRLSYISLVHHALFFFTKLHRIEVVDFRPSKIPDQFPLHS